jgi:membrane fusion protein
VTERAPLFRPEAIAFQRLRQSGEVVMLQPVGGRILFWSLVAVSLLVFAFLVLANYARKETVVGYLVPAAGIARVHVPRAGTVSAVHVAEGDEVAAGQPLFTVAVDQTAADGQNVDAALLATLARQKASLTEQIAMQQGRETSERTRLAAQIAGAREAIARLEEQMTVQTERLRLAESLVASIEALRSKGVASEVEYKRRVESTLESRQNLGALGQQIAGRRTELAQATAALEQLPTMIAEKVQSLRNLLAESEQRMAEIEGRRAYVVRAPIAGRVTTLQAAVGRAVDPGPAQLAILPHDSTLQAELFVRAQAIGFVRPGQEVRVLYDAFPYQRFGTYGGRIVGVARTMVTRADIAGPVALREPAYRVTVRLDRQEIAAYGTRVPLQPDMLLKADIVLDRRSLLTWLLDPLLGARIS